MILSDKDILLRIKEKSLKITPFNKRHVQPSTYDVTLSNKFRVFDNYELGYVDVRRPVDPSRLLTVKNSNGFIIHPKEFVLGATKEVISVPNDLAAMLEGRSSIGRLGLIVHATAGYIDPGFSGTITLEISNISNLPIKIYPQMRIGQLCFYQMSSEVNNPYGSKRLGSKYQGQIDPTGSRIEKDLES